MASDKKIMMSVIVTTSPKLKDLIIKDGQLVFMHDVGRIAMDYNGKRIFYNQIVTLDSEAERVAMSDVVDGYYFVIETGVLWHHHGGWYQVSGVGSDTVFIGDELPELGVAKKLYVNKKTRDITVWDDASSGYVVVADKTDINSIEDKDIESLFV